MAQNPVPHPIEHSTKDNVFYFQFILTKLAATTPRANQTQQFFFSISKGWQIIESTKSFIVNWKEGEKAEVGHERLNFVVLHYNPEKIQEFYLRISLVSSPDEQIGQYFIDCKTFIEHFTTKNNGAFIQSLKLGTNFILEAEVYVERSRFNIEKLVREMKNSKKGQKSNSHIFQTIPEKGGELKTRGSSTQKQNRFRRTPSPSRKIITQKLREQSPKRPAIGPRKNLINQASSVEKTEIIRKKEQVMKQDSKLSPTAKQSGIQSPIQAPQNIQSKQNQLITETSKNEILIPYSISKQKDNELSKQHQLRAQVQLIDEKTVQIQIGEEIQLPKIQDVDPSFKKTKETVQGENKEEQPVHIEKISQQQVQNVKIEQQPAQAISVEEKPVTVKVQEVSVQPLKVEQQPAYNAKIQEKITEVIKAQSQPAKEVRTFQPVLVTKDEEKLVQEANIKQEPVQIIKNEQIPVQTIKVQEKSEQIVKTEDKPVQTVAFQVPSAENANIQKNLPNQVQKVKEITVQYQKIDEKPVQIAEMQEKIVFLQKAEEKHFPIIAIDQAQVQAKKIEDKPSEHIVEQKIISVVKKEEPTGEAVSIEVPHIQAIKTEEQPNLIQKVEDLPVQVVRVEETPIQLSIAEKKIVNNQLDSPVVLKQGQNILTQGKQQQGNFVDRAAQNWNKLVGIQRQSKESKEVIVQNIQQTDKIQNANQNENVQINGEEQKPIQLSTATKTSQKLRIIVPILIILIVTLLAFFSLRSSPKIAQKSSPKGKIPQQKPKSTKKTATKPKKI